MRVAIAVLAAVVVLGGSAVAVASTGTCRQPGAISRSVTWTSPRSATSSISSTSPSMSASTCSRPSTFPEPVFS